MHRLCEAAQGKDRDFVKVTPGVCDSSGNSGEGAEELRAEASDDPGGYSDSNGIPRAGAPDCETEKRKALQPVPRTANSELCTLYSVPCTLYFLVPCTQPCVEQLSNMNIHISTSRGKGRELCAGACVRRAHHLHIEAGIPKKQRRLQDSGRCIDCAKLLRGRTETLSRLRPGYAIRAEIPGRAPKN